MAATGDEQNQIFVSYAHSDQKRVLPVCDWLRDEGFNVWVDRRRLMPGQNWDFEIKKALDRADLVIVFVSNNSVDHRGYAQREIRAALDKLSEKLIDDIYLIPVILDEGVVVPELLRSLHHTRVGRTAPRAAGRCAPVPIWTPRHSAKSKTTRT
jgi:hypothetical protein